MIDIYFFKNAVLIKGHAETTKSSNELCCAGVSAISMGALNWFKKSDIKFSTQDGYLLLQVINLSIDNVRLLKLLKIQLLALNHDEYMKYIIFHDLKSKEFENE